MDINSTTLAGGKITINYTYKYIFTTNWVYLKILNNMMILSFVINKISR